jgi:biotin carboxylase
VVKPVTGTGSVDVRLCGTRAEIEEAVKTLLSRTSNERGMPITPKCLIEEYVSGPEYSVETFNDSVIGITRKHLSPEPYFVETGHDFPAILPLAISRSIIAAASSAVAALGLGFGPAHTELRYCPDRGAVIIEVNPRLAGGFIPSMVKLATGVDVIRATVALVSGREIDVLPKHAGHASIRFIVAGSAGILKGFEGMEEARAMPGIAEVQAYCSSGGAIRVQHDFRDRIGHVIATGSTANAATAAACAALSQIKINMLPFEEHE